MMRPARALAALALLLAALAPLPAQAQTARPVEDGALHWGFKQSFRSYVGRQIGAIGPIGPAPEGERVRVIAPATFDLDGTPAWSTSPSQEAYPYRFPVSQGSYADAENLVVRTTGGVRFAFPSHYFELTLSDLAVEVTGGQARLRGDVHQVATQDFGQYREGEYLVEDGVIATIGRLDVSAEGDTLTLRAAELVVHEEAAVALPQEAGEALDELTLTARLGAPVESAPTPSPSPSAGATPQPGALSWRVEGGVGAVSLGTADVTDGGFLATATLPTVVVEDTRTGGPAWRVTAEVSDFTGASGSISARHLGWVPVLESAGGGAVAGPAVPPRLASDDGKGKGLGKARTLGSAPAGHAQGTARLGGTLELLAPPATEPGEYRAVLTITVVG